MVLLFENNRVVSLQICFLVVPFGCMPIMGADRYSLVGVCMILVCAKNGTV